MTMPGNAKTASTPNSRAAATNRHSWVLVIEDGAIEATLLQAFLSSAKCEVIVDDGTNAWNIINDWPPPDVVLLDLVLPKTNGMQLLDHIRSSRRWKSVPVVVISGMAEESTVVRQLLSAGVTAVLAKPFDPFRIRRELEKFVSFEEPQQGGEGNAAAGSSASDAAASAAD